MRATIPKELDDLDLTLRFNWLRGRQNTIIESLFDLRALRISKA
jgi:hypothetical protein